MTCKRASNHLLWVATLCTVMAACSADSGGDQFVAEGSGAPQTLCAKFGFVPGTANSTSCVAQLQTLYQQDAQAKVRCEGDRQRVLGTPARQQGGFGSNVTNADVAYQNCLNTQPGSRTQVQLPDGRTVQCRAGYGQIRCI